MDENCIMQIAIPLIERLVGFPVYISRFDSNVTPLPKTTISTTHDYLTVAVLTYPVLHSQ